MVIKTAMINIYRNLKKKMNIIRKENKLLKKKQISWLEKSWNENHHGMGIIAD